jgi:MarR family transcriptional regulator, negative regulator of the multidrug operon emrRAB
MHDTARTANLLGAAALGVADLLLEGATALAGVGQSASAGLVMLTHAPGLSVTELGRRIGLSQPATARMVDQLESQGLVERRASLGRAVAVHPTRSGRRASSAALAGRQGLLSELVADMSETEQEALDGVLTKMLASLEGRIGHPDVVCRLCDRPACIAQGAVCPVSQAARSAESERA